MSNITLTWRERNADETAVRVYRSTTPMDTNNLPTPIADLPPNSESWEDATAEAYQDYYYRVSSVRNGTERVSSEMYVPSVPLNMGAGSDELVGGDLRKTGFFGEVPFQELITGNSLATQIGLTAGTAQFGEEPWLKFVIDGEIVFIAKKPYRHSISWEHIYQAGAVYGTGDNGLYPSGGNRTQDATVEIGGNTYRVTLLKGANSDPTIDQFRHDGWWTHQSEWNRLMYPIHSGVHTDDRNPDIGSVPYGQWATYSDEDLLVHNSFGSGSYSWTQETPSNDATRRLNRGLFGVSTVRRATATLTNSDVGWRPCLRLAQ